MMFAGLVSPLEGVVLTKPATSSSELATYDKGS